MQTDCELMEKVRQWNATERPYPQNRCIHQLFEDQAAKTPDAIAVVFEDQALTYSQLNAKANQLAHYLRRQGVRADVPVGICMDRSLEMMVALLAILKAGGGYVPLDPLYPAERLRFMAEDVGLKLILADAGLQAIFPGSIERIDSSQTAVFESHPTDNPSWEGTSEDLAYIVFTSGSTGTPKGVAVPHRGVVRLVFGQEYMEFGPELTMLQLAPVSFDASTLEIWGPLLHGGRCVLYPGRIPELDRLEQVLLSRKVNALWLTASLFNLVIDTRPEILRTVATVLTGGEALSVPHVRKALQALPEVQLVNGYGPTESTTFTCCYRIPKILPERLTSIPIGRPIANTQVYILDRNLRPVPIGAAGELYIGGDGLAGGYVNRPELTAERFVPNPFRPNSGERLYKSGDLCRWLEDGTIEFLGRTDDQVKIRGFRIELGEIENVLRNHPSIRQAVAVVREDEPGQKVLVAYGVPHEKGKLDEGALRKHLAAKLPEYMVPSAFVEIDTIPLTASGKADRKSLPKPAIGEQDQRAGTPPGTEIEIQLAEIWKKILGIDSVYREDHFFHLGGHSLKAIQAVYRVQNQFDIQISVSSLFETPTLQAFSAVVESLRTSDRNKAIVIPIVSRQEHIPQSFAQQRMWFIEQLSPGLSVYNISFILLMEGELKVDVLERSLHTIIDRHDAFRTTFGLVDGKAIQVIQSRISWSLKVEEVSVSSGKTVEEELIAFAQVQAKQLFDLVKGPLFDFRLLKAKGGHYGLLLNMHHLITDGWSMGVIADELSELYCAELLGRKPYLAELPIQYADFGIWQRHRIQSLLDQSLGYWRESLSGDAPEVTLQTDRPRPAVQTFSGRWIYYSIDSQVYARLRKLSRDQQVTLNMTMMTAIKVLLHRVLGMDEITIGGPISGRTHRETENMVGYFVNTVVLKTRLSGDLTFIESLNRVQQTCHKAQEHQELPYDILVEQLNPQRDPSRNLFFQIMFAYQDARYWQPKLPGLHIRSVELGTDTSKIDLTVFAEENDQGLLLRAEYNTDLYNETTIRRFLRLYEHVLRIVAECPNQRIDRISLLTQEDASTISAWNATDRPYPQNRCIHQLFEDQAAKTPDAIAVVFEDQALTYSQLNDKANQLAHYLRRQGVRADVPVGICMDRSLEMMVALLAILKAGGGYVPLDPLYPAERLRFMAEDVGLKMILADAGLQAIFPGSIRSIDPSQTAVFESHPTDNPGWEGTSEDLAYIVFTSGSTGTPKGVAIPHRGVVRLLFGTDFMKFGPELVMLQLAPVSFDASTLEIWGPLLHGGRCVLYPGRIPELDRLEQVLLSRKVNALWLTASLFNLVIDTRPEILRTVATVLTGGEALSVTHVRKALETLPEVQLVNGYGPTESTTFTCCHRIPKSLPEGLTSIPIGRPIGNTQVYILDSHLQLVPIGVPGELYIGGDGLARGYVNRLELTAERFVHNPFSEDRTSRLYKTGDICRWLEDGTVEFLGRTDDQVKIRGFRIELGEIENVLRNHPSIRQAVAVVREDEPGQKVLVAYGVPHEKGKLDEGALRKHLAAKLPEYMVPSAFVEIDTIPLTASGKADRKRLPRPHSPDDSQMNTPPRTQTEIQLAGIWKGLLKREAVCREDHFFRLGGHSLLAAELFFRIQDQFSIHLPIPTIFQAPTLSQLAAAIDAATAEMTTRDLVQIKAGSGAHPIFYLPGIGGHTLSFYHLAEAMQIDSPQYGLNLRGLDGKTKPQERIEEMASYFIELVRAVQPKGPYNLCGFSFGGRVAFEMALQLQACGETIGFLGLIGATAPGYPPMPSNPLFRIGYRLYDFGRIGWKRQWRYLRFKIPNILSRMRRSWKSRRMGKGNVTQIIVSHQKPVVNSAMKAWFHYQPARRFVGEAAVFREGRTLSDLYARYDDPEYGWGKYVDGEVHAHLIDCGHMEMFRSPHVIVLGKMIEQCLQEAKEK